MTHPTEAADLWLRPPRAHRLRRPAGWGHQRHQSHALRDSGTAAVAVLLDVLLFSDAVLHPVGATVGATHRLLAGCCALIGWLLLRCRRRYPVVVLLATVAWSLTTALGTGYRPVVPVCVAAFCLASRGERRVLTLVAPSLVLDVGAWTLSEARSNPQLVTGQAVAAVAIGYTVLLGLVVTAGRLHRAGALRVRVAERGRREAVHTERRRMARELHDIVAHAVTVMVLHADAARRILPKNPRGAAEALTVVTSTGSTAVTELRRLLGVLRADDQNASEAPVPGPGLDDLPNLLATTSVIGVHARLRHDGTPRHLAPAAALAAFRVVQEGLTNVARHAGPGTGVEVRLTWTAVALRVEVDNDGAGSASASDTDRTPRRSSTDGLSTGSGLVGLAERLALLGGALRSGPRAGGGFRLVAEIPYPGPDAAAAAAAGDDGWLHRDADPPPRSAP